MTILLTSGTGKTATAIAHLLKDANEPVLFASRKGVVLEAFKASDSTGTSINIRKCLRCRPEQ